MGLAQRRAGRHVRPYSPAVYSRSAVQIVRMVAGDGVIGAEGIAGEDRGGGQNSFTSTSSPFSTISVWAGISM